MTVRTGTSGGVAASADAGRITRTGGRRSATGRLGAVGSMLVFASIRPPPKPMAKMTKAVPTPAKNRRAFDAMAVSRYGNERFKFDLCSLAGKNGNNNGLSY